MIGYTPGGGGEYSIIRSIASLNRVRSTPLWRMRITSPYVTRSYSVPFFGNDSMVGGAIMRNQAAAVALKDSAPREAVQVRFTSTARWAGSRRRTQR